MKYAYLFLLSLFSIPFLAQENNNPLRDMKFRNVGPAGMSGRVTSIDVNLKNDQEIYAGTASGGLWRSRSGGQKWECIFNNEATLSIGAVKLSQKNTDVIWVGTGEGNPRNSHNSGKGIYKSIDGGVTWKLMGLENTRNIHKVLIHPDNENIVYAAAIGVAWGESEDRGVYKTTDGGLTWSKILYANEITGAADLVMDPENPNKLIVAMWEHRRWPWFFHSGGEGSGIHVTHDGGLTWKKRTDKNGLPKGELGRVGLAISKSNTKVVYALVENEKKNALYRSNDGGLNFFKVSENENIGNRPFYYSDIHVSPENEDILYSLWTYLSKSKDGGKTWTRIPYNRIHPDHHAFWVHPEQPNYLIEGNDGGLNISRDAGDTWRFVENLPLAQFYHINIDNEMPYNIYGGMQDNGSWVGPAYSWTSGAITNAQWQEVYFGDGFDVVPDPEDVRYMYAMSQGGNVSRIDKNTGASKIIKPRHPNGVDLRYNWNAAIAQDPFDDSTIYFGSQFVHKSENKGSDWAIISPDLTTNDTSKQHQLTSGGLTYDVTGAENYTTVLTINPSPITKGEIWVGTDDGRLQLTKDGGENWTDLAGRLKGMPEGAWIPFIHVSKYNKGEAFVVVNDYRRNNWKPFLFHTMDYGKSFENIANPDSVGSFCLSVIQDPVEENLLFLGADDGLYFSLNKGADWQKWAKDFPSVQVSDLKIQEREKDLVVGTFGRAAWVLDDIEPLRKLASKNVEWKEEVLNIFSPPTGVIANYKRANGTRFAADAIYKGDNRGSGGRLQYWINTESDSALKKLKEVSFLILDANNDSVRSFKSKYHEGLNSAYWGLNEKGANYPQRKTRSKKDLEKEPSGVSVVPGVYKVVAMFGENSDTTIIEVIYDPRVDVSLNDLQKRQSFLKDVESQTRKMNSATSKLNAIQDNVDILLKLANEMEIDSSLSETKKRLKSLNDSISGLEKLVFGIEDVKGYLDQPETWEYQFGELYYGSYSNYGEPLQNQQIMLKEIKELTAELTSKINKFISEDWVAFENYLAENPIALTKNIETIKNE